MKVTYGEIMGANRAAQALMQNGSASVSPLAALKLARAVRIVAQEAQAFEAGRVALVKKHASEPDEKGNQQVPPERIAEFNAELNDLAKQEVEIDVQPLSLTDFGDCKIGLTAFVGMEWLVSDE